MAYGKLSLAVLASVAALSSCSDKMTPSSSSDNTAANTGYTAPVAPVPNSSSQPSATQSKLQIRNAESQAPVSTQNIQTR